MQRLFFAFPSGLPGAGLLLLRAAVCLTSFYEAQLFPSTLTVPYFLLVLLKAGVFTAMLSVLIGLTTPIASLSLGIVAACSLLLTLSPWPSFTQNELLLLDLTIMAAVSAAVGPGAFSVDARLFGRREITFPD